MGNYGTLFEYMGFMGHLGGTESIIANIRVQMPTFLVRKHTQFCSAHFHCMCIVNTYKMQT